MRGIYNLCFSTGEDIRFNPAYAGNMRSGISQSLKIWVQPRVCGEYCPPNQPHHEPRGSTPRMRGISILCAISSLLSRFNPAYAGNIASLLVHHKTFQVQPRVCGEYIVSIVKRRLDPGSTPRMRGIYNFLAGI